MHVAFTSGAHVVEIARSSAPGHPYSAVAGINLAVYPATSESAIVRGLHTIFPSSNHVERRPKDQRMTEEDFIELSLLCYVIALLHAFGVTVPGELHCCCMTLLCDFTVRRY
jgi:hypothetical protein